MSMHKLTTIIVLGIVAATSVAAPPTPVPRKAPEFSFFNPSGKAIALSNFKGKVVVMEFLFIGSMHCVRVAQILNTLKGELGPRGLQPVAIAFSAPHSEANQATVDSFAQSYNLAFPVGYTSKDSVDRCLGRSDKEMLAIPQVVVIDRGGMIRAQTGQQYNPLLEDEGSLRTLLDNLLKENPPADSPAKTAPPAPTKKTRH